MRPRDYRDLQNMPPRQRKAYAKLMLISAGLTLLLVLIVIGCTEAAISQGCQQANQQSQSEGAGNACP